MRPSQETYDHALAQGVLADQLGFDYIVAKDNAPDLQGYFAWEEGIPQTFG